MRIGKKCGADASDASHAVQDALELMENEKHLHISVEEEIKAILTDGELESSASIAIQYDDQNQMGIVRYDGEMQSDSFPAAKIKYTEYYYVENEEYIIASVDENGAISKRDNDSKSMPSLYRYVVADLNEIAFVETIVVDDIEYDIYSAKYIPAQYMRSIEDNSDLELDYQRALSLLPQLPQSLLIYIEKDGRNVEKIDVSCDERIEKKGSVLIMQAKRTIQ